jgi:hypothetical protein
MAILVAQQGAAPLTSPLAPQWAALIIVGTFLAGYGLYRLSRVRLFSRFRPYALLGLLLFWGLALTETVFVVSYFLTASWFILSLVLLSIATATNYQWLRNLMAGVAVAFEDRMDYGDAIRVGPYEGTVQEFGLRAVEIRGNDGRRHEIPNFKLVDESVSNLARGGDSISEVTLPIPEGISVEEARAAGREAALVSPFASPHREPEIYIEANEAADTAPTLHVRGYAFDGAHQERYESDVTTRLFELLGVDEED